MKTNSDWAPGPDPRILATERQGEGWVVTAEAGMPSGVRSSVSMQPPLACPPFTRSAGSGGSHPEPKGRMWRCRDPRCDRRTFTARLPLIAEPLARRTRRVRDLARLHASGVCRSPQLFGGTPKEGFKPETPLVAV
jgi:hypothetical protein